MRKVIIFFLIISSLLSCSNPKNEFPAKWLLLEKSVELYGPRWSEGDHKIVAGNGSSATISAVGDGLEYYHHRGFPLVRNIKENDYILFEAPVKKLKKGSYIGIDAVVVSQPDAPKYFIIEYLEGGKWKHVESDVKPVPENPELLYTFICSGRPEGIRYEHASVYQTIRLEKTLKNSKLKIRFRAVGPYTCNDTLSGAGNAIGIARYGYTGAYLQDYGTCTPSDTTEILCLGNSFTYHANAPSMLKEIAWSEGHCFRIKAHVKGGQNFRQHCNLKLTDIVINSQEFDYAILQNQSQAAARYAADKEKYSVVMEDCLQLSGLIRKKSPDCNIIIENTWTYVTSNYGGFGDTDTFEALLAKGTAALAEGCNGQVSPIGKAFRIVNDGDSGINLYDTDKKHQSAYGTYLKSCVNYLVITGERFSDQTSSCGLEPSRAKYLREAAEKAVFEN